MESVGFVVGVGWGRPGRVGVRATVASNVRETARAAEKEAPAGGSSRRPRTRRAKRRPGRKGKGEGPGADESPAEGLLGRDDEHEVNFAGLQLGTFGQRLDVDGADESSLPGGDKEEKGSAKSYRASRQAYMKECDLLKRAEEVDLARKIQAHCWVEKEKDSLKGELQRQPTFTEWAKRVDKKPAELRQVVVDGTLAKQRLVSANVRLVHSIVGKIRRSRAPSADTSKTQDLIQEGHLGLIRAAEKYDADKGFRFSTYATYWIMSAVARATNRIDRLVRLPNEIHELSSRMNKAHREYLRQNGREPTEPELAKATGVSVAKLRFVLESLRKQTVSLHLNVGGDDQEPKALGDLLASDADLEEELVDNMLRSDLDEALRKYLKPRERAALRLRYGLDDGAERTLREIGKVLNLSSERTRQILFDAIVKLRRHDIQKQFIEYLPQLAGDANGVRATLAVADSNSNPTA